ncbi:MULTISPECIES: hypothetical protein [Pseudomonas syringae group]|uniref:hypothetical protein n=1 Tax=Pseudomonas syringae group TaxID=136849 RepID=UPI0002F5EC6E|nr:MULTISPECIES: hypothetical protein [Pseudomonas syringae group]MBA4706309.1 hypothetical protein [Pseudomonas savastanoi pv. savastanoi]RMN63267.1 hypothetical protein ALQ55_200190 [Pseudomonas savastanoi pv. savastanoi]
MEDAVPMPYAHLVTIEAHWVQDLLLANVQAEYHVLQTLSVDVNSDVRPRN